MPLSCALTVGPVLRPRACGRKRGTKLLKFMGEKSLLPVAICPGHARWFKAPRLIARVRE